MSIRHYVRRPPEASAAEAMRLITELGFDAVSLSRGLVGWRAAGGALEGERVG